MINAFQFFLENAKGKDVEAVHQRTLAWLLTSKTICNTILDLSIDIPKTKMEVHGRGGKLFDIQINENNSEIALIEIKMWAMFGEK